MSIKVTYELRPHHSPNFHGWIVWECSAGMESVYYQSESYEDAYAVYKDCHPEEL